jgi:hypothetical protein
LSYGPSLDHFAKLFFPRSRGVSTIPVGEVELQFVVGLFQFEGSETCERLFRKMGETENALPASSSFVLGAALGGFTLAYAETLVCLRGHVKSVPIMPTTCFIEENGDSRHIQKFAFNVEKTWSFGIIT